MDGEKPVVIFGMGAEHFSEKEQAQHAATIRLQRLIPTFALEGPLATAAKPPKTKPVQKPLASRHRIGLREKKPPMALKQNSQQGIMDRLSGGKDNAPKTSIVSTRSQHSLIGHLRAQLSINFGRCRLLHLPLNCLPANYLPPFNAAEVAMTSLFEANAMKQGRVASQKKPKAKKEEKEQGGIFDDVVDPAKQSWSHFPPETHEKHQAGLIITRITNKWLKRRKRGKANALQIKSAICIQRSFRAYRIRTMGSKHKAAFKIISVWKGVKARKTYRLLNQMGKKFHDLERVAIVIQSAFRVGLARRSAKQLAEHNVLRAKFMLSLTIMIQRRFRARHGYRYRPVKNWKERTLDLESKRAKDAEEASWTPLGDYNSQELQLITKVQACFRGHILRVLIKHVNKVLHNKLQTIRADLKHHELALKAAKRLQSWWRSRSATKKFKDMLWNIQVGMGIVVKAFRRTAARMQLEKLGASRPKLLLRVPDSPNLSPRDSPRAGDNQHLVRPGSAIIGNGNAIDVLKYFVDGFAYPSPLGNPSYIAADER